MTTPSGVPITGQAAINMGIECGTLNADKQRTNFNGFGNINTLRDVANSTYHSLQVSANRTIGDLSLSLAYTYSHSIDDSSDRGDTAFVNAYNFAANRASSNFDLRHNLSISYVYSLPFFRGSGMAHTALGGWQVSGITVAQTGLPFSVTNPADNAGVANGAGTSSRPDLVGNPHATPTPDGNRGPLLYNPAAYAAPQGLTFGDVGRNTLNLPGRVNFDFGVYKKFQIKENAGFEFRWENYNLFNHTQFNGLTPSNLYTSAFGSSTFLHLTNTHDPRRMQFGLRFYF